jgi:hypothetical protein
VALATGPTDDNDHCEKLKFHVLMYVISRKNLHEGQVGGEEKSLLLLS